MALASALFALAAAGAPGVAHAAFVSTVAGAAGSSGSQDGPFFNTPAGVAVDASGNLYVAEGDDTIRKITPAGVVTTLAGTAGQAGSTDGTGAAARFLIPCGVAVDSSGNVYVGDTGNDTIRKITPAGVVTTLAGTAGQAGSTDGTGAAARFRTPYGIAIDASGNLYVADTNNDTIRKITPAGVVTTLAGTAGAAGSTDGTGTAARFNSPLGIAIDASGNVYVADSDNDTIRKITPAGVVTTLAGTAGVAGSTDGTGAAARFSFPLGIGVDAAGNVYVADSNNDTIRKITPAGVVTTLAGTAGAAGSTDGTGAAARFNTPYGLAVDASGNVYVADKVNDTIRKITPAGVVTTPAGTAGQVGSTNGGLFNAPVGVAVDASGNLYVADSRNDTIRKITAAGVVTTLAGSAGSAGSTDGTGAAARFNTPLGVAVDASGNVYVADSANDTIRKITAAGVVTTLAGTAGQAGSADGTGAAARFKTPYGVAVDSSGNVYVADTGNDTIRKITPAGVVTTLAGTAGAAGSTDGTGAAARFRNPLGVAVDSSGNVYVADSTNDTIRKITPAGVVTTLAGTAGAAGSTDGTGAAARFNSPCGVAIDASGNVYVGDQTNDTIRKITPAGVVTTLAGTAGAAGSTDGAGAAARFNSPCGVAIDASGNLYVGDKGNSAIRKMIPGPAPVTGVSPALAAGAGSLWFTASPSLTLTAGDAGGGVAQTWYRLDGGSWTQYTSALTPAGDGLHTLSYYSTAADGTAETTHAGYFGIDTTPPLTTATGLAAGATLDWHSSAASFTLVASDATSGPAATFYTIDSGSAQLYSGAPVLLGADGSYTITYWSVDIAGKVETPHTAYLNIDATPPSAISGLASATHPSQTTWYTNTTPGFGWSAATDAGSGVAGYACVLDQTSGTVPAATVTTEATSASFPSRADGTYYFHIRAVDNAGNGGPPSQYVVKIDSTPPSAISGLASATHPSQTTWYTNTTPGFGWSAATDAGSGVAGYACVLDQTSGTVPAATVTTEATSASFPSRADGTYYFHIRAVDNAGNGGPPSQYVVKIDSTPPITTAPGLASTAGSSWSSATPRPVSLAAGDTGSGLLATYYTLDSGGQQTYTSPLSISGEGLHTVTYWSLDTAGNIEQPHTGFVGIDTTPPTVSDNSDGAWHDAGVTVTLSPSDPGGSGIAKTQYRLQGSGTWLDTTADQFVAPAPSSSSNDGAQTYEYRAIDLAGNASASGSCTVKFDTTAPTTVASSSDGLALDGSTWHGGALTVTFAPTDPSDTHGTCSGVRSTQYSTDGGATWITGTSVTYPVWKRGGGSGNYTLLYRSTDWAGNIESQKSVPVLIDCTAPTTTASGADLAWHAMPVTVSFTATDAGCGVASTHYRVDDGTWMIGTSVTIPAPANGSGDGIHAIDYYSVD